MAKEIRNYNAAADSNTSASPDGAPEGWSPAVVNNVQREVMARLRRWYNDVSPVAVSTGGTSSAYALTVSQDVSTQGLTSSAFVFRAHTANAGTTTLNVNGTGAKTVKKHQSLNLRAGDWRTNQIVSVAYSPADGAYHMLSPVGLAAQSGAVVQAVSTSYASNSAITDIIPSDTTVPQISEGAQIMSASITPTAAANKLVIDVSIHVGLGVGVTAAIAAIFNTDTHASNALAAAYLYDPDAMHVGYMRIYHEMTVPGTGTYTFTCRCGPASTGSVYVNGDAAGGDYLGAALVSYMRITECLA